MYKIQRQVGENTTRELDYRSDVVSKCRNSRAPPGPSSMLRPTTRDSTNQIQNRPEIMHVIRTHSIGPLNHRRSTSFPNAQCLTPGRPGTPSALFQPLDPDQFPVTIKQRMVITLPQPKRWSTFFNRAIGRSGEWVHHRDQPGGWV